MLAREPLWTFPGQLTQADLPSAQAEALPSLADTTLMSSGQGCITY